MREFPAHPRRTLSDHLWGTVRDEDGRRVRPLRSERRRKHVRRWDRRKEFSRARWRATAAWGKWLVTASLGAFVSLVVTVVVMAMLGFEPEGWAAVVVRDGLLGSIGAVIVSGVVMSVLDDKAATRALLSMRVCVGCFYDLRGTPERERGVVVCPECGSAWRVEAGDG